jgi:lipopolysaccharide/colanic/teichoic acid biosynthesis glycosyltransferase
MIQRLLALVLLVFLSPAMGLLYVLVKLDSKGPFVFRQKRLGENKRPFSLYKIRTMKVGSQTEQNKLRSFNQADGPVFKIHDDPRFTRAGRLISHTGLDELLQLVNIIKGEMAFVGPRPLPKKEADKIAKKYQRRFMVLPGITSLWVVRGAQHQDFASWMKDDLEYINNKSLKLDLVIIIKSIKMLILMLWRQLIKN